MNCGKLDEFQIQCNVQSLQIHWKLPTNTSPHDTFYCSVERCELCMHWISDCSDNNAPNVRRHFIVPMQKQTKDFMRWERFLSANSWAIKQKPKNTFVRKCIRIGMLLCECAFVLVSATASMQEHTFIRTNYLAIALFIESLLNRKPNSTVKKIFTAKNKKLFPFIFENLKNYRSIFVKEIRIAIDNIKIVEKKLIKDYAR